MSVLGQSLETKPDAPAARAALIEMRPAPEMNRTCGAGDLAAQPLADLGARLVADEQVDERDVRLVAPRQRRAPPRRCARSGSARPTAAG